ncbi:pre-mRNA-splicing factor (BUD31) [Vairimorpha necatrix]|uniref:Pre-mRNA-splicing factor (BUD31) n=1 Tax=Vairimorpha necatrix TaxID=6039 RepID=A0AAX4J9Y2_9MICR
MDELIDFLREINEEMRKEGANIFKLHYERNRKISDMLKNKTLSMAHYKKLISHNLADKNLIDKWATPGYEKLCCLRCAQPRVHKYNTVCKCRIPEKYKDKEFHCKNCQCTGCGSY